MLFSLFTTFAGLTALTLSMTVEVIGGESGQSEGKGNPEFREPAGHLKPFGAHRPAEGSIDQVSGFLEPNVFYEEYARPSKPVLFKQAAKGIPAFDLWADKYLSNKYGTMLVDVEKGKKENRSHGLESITMKEFLAIYSKENIYMVQDVREEMKEDLSLPKCLWCGGYQDALELGVIWFSSGGTKSVLHYDMVDNINCLLDGDKTIRFIDKKHHKRVEAYGFRQEGTFSEIDVEAVDLLQYPNFEHVPWWLGKMEKGDCLFIPQSWYHTVESSKSRNLAVNLWFVHLMWFNQSDCDEKTKDVLQIPEYDSLDKYELSIYNKMGGSIEKIRSDIFDPFEHLPEVSLEAAITEWGDYGDEADIQIMFEVMDEDKDMTLSWEEIYKVDILSLIMDFPFILSDITPEELDALQEAYPHDPADPYEDELRDEL